MTGPNDPHGQLSPDGRWRWDGQQWQPVDQPPQPLPQSEPPQPPPGKRSVRLQLLIGFGGLALLAVMGVCISAVTASGRGSQPQATPAAVAATATAAATVKPIAAPTVKPTAAPTAAAPTTAPTPIVPPQAPPPAPPATAPPPPTAAALGCYPLTNSGNCYEPGEYCRNSDHGMTGRAGNGESIICEYNNGWRWEPA
jgi:hypothetical protein